MNSNPRQPTSSSDDVSSDEGDTFDVSASYLTFLVEDSKGPGGKWIHPGPHTPTKLRFADYAEVQFTTGLHEYSPEEIERCWMNSFDEADAQGEIVDTVRHMRKPPEDWWKWFSASQDGNIADGTKKTIEEQEENFSRYLEEELGLCTRGIEHMKSKGAREQRQLRRKFIAQVVLEEQEHQRRLEMHNSEAIAEGANILSRKSTEKATKAAATDEQYADSRRGSLPAEYAKTMVKQMFFAQSSRKFSIYSTDEEEDEDEEKERGVRDRRSSSISYERHDGVVLEEICHIIESEESCEAQKIDCPSSLGKDSAKSILARMKEDIIRAKEEEGVLEKEDSTSPTKKEITGITDSLQNTHLSRKSDAPRRTLSSAKKQNSFRRIGLGPASNNFLDNWGDYQLSGQNHMLLGQNHMRRLMHTRTHKSL